MREDIIEQWLRMWIQKRNSGIKDDVKSEDSSVGF